MTPHKLLIVGVIVMALLAIGAIVENWRDHRRMTLDEQSTANAWLLALAIAFFVFLILCAAAFARDLDGRYAQSPLKPWFDGLKSGKGLCCSDADGSAISDADWEVKDGRYRVRVPIVEGGNVSQWIDVPEDAVITEPNRAGKTMVWPLYGFMGVSIRCFMPGSMT